MTALQRFITASGMTNLADGIAVVAWGWIASLLTRDAFLIGLWLPLAFGVNAAAYGLAMLLVAGLAGPFKTVRTDRRGWRAEIGEGIAFLRGMPLLKTLAWTTGFWNLFHQMIVIGVVLHAQENLGLSAQAYGLTLAGGALGGIAGSLMGDRIGRALGPTRTMQWMLLASGPCFVGMALAPGAWTLGACFAAMEFSGFVWNVVSVSTRQRLIPDALLGRVNSIYRLLAWGMMPLGLVLSGVVVSLGELVTARGTALVRPFWAAGLGSVVVTILVWRAIARGFAGISR